MTGMPASLAFWSAGRMALLSWASRIRTLAPCEISVSTSVNCCSALRFASALMYLPPPASTVFLEVGLVVRRPARLLEVVPRNADGAVRGRRGCLPTGTGTGGRGGRAARSAARRAATRTCREDEGRNRDQRRKSTLCHSLLSSSSGPYGSIGSTCPALGYHPPKAAFRGGTRVQPSCSVATRRRS